MWHYARACAFHAKGEGEKAEQQRRGFLAGANAIPADVMVSMTNTAQSVLGIAEAVLDAKFALAQGNRTKAVELLQKASQKEDALNYGEPPDWLIPVRETLGATLLTSGAAGEAERAFRANLNKHPRDGRCLFGLRESLKAQRLDYAAQQVDKEFQAAWKNADVKTLRLEDY